MITIWVPKRLVEIDLYNVAAQSPAALAALPTGGAGKSFSGLRADQFQRRTSVVRMDRNAVLNSAPYVAEFARVEGLDAHNHSIQVRAARVDR